jgi:hypothetical protein
MTTVLEKDILSGWDDFPKIGLVVEGNKAFYPLREAIPLWDSGWVKVEDSGELLEQDFHVRKMTPEENLVFQERVDTYSASK